VRENLRTVQSGTEITAGRLQELIEFATVAAQRAPQVAYGEVFNCVLRILIVNEYKTPTAVDLVVSYVDEAIDGQASV
jgi:hypothetical protein